MASEILFDLSSIDLDQIAVDRDEVGSINLQCGEMRQLDHLILLQRETGHALGVKQVRHDEFWVPLHIPGRPLMPGVLMIEAVAQLCSVQYRKIHSPDDPLFIGFARCDDAVFRGQVVPGDTLYLLSREISVRPRRFVSATQAVVNGKLVFEAKITGMTL